MRASFAYRDLTELELALDREALEHATRPTFNYIAGGTLVAALREAGGPDAPMRVFRAAGGWVCSPSAPPRIVWGHLLAEAKLPSLEVLEQAYHRQWARALATHEDEVKATPRLMGRRVRDDDEEALEVSVLYADDDAPRLAGASNRYGRGALGVVCEIGIGEQAQVVPVVGGRCRLLGVVTEELPIMLRPDSTSAFLYAERRVPLSAFSWETPTLPPAPAGAARDLMTPPAGAGEDDGGAARRVSSDGGRAGSGASRLPDASPDEKAAHARQPSR